MKRRVVCGLALVLAFSLTASARQSSEGKTSNQSFAFQRGQKVYIIAFRPLVFREPRRYPIYFHSHRKYIQKIIPDRGAEKRIRKEFEALQTFRLVEDPGEADFVFLVFIDNDGAEGLAFAPEKYAEIKGKIDFNAPVDLGQPLPIEPFREAAWVRSQAGPFKFPTVKRTSNHLAKKFHETAKNSKPAS